MEIDFDSGVHVGRRKCSVEILACQSRPRRYLPSIPKVEKCHVIVTCPVNYKDRLRSVRRSGVFSEPIWIDASESCLKNALFFR